MLLYNKGVEKSMFNQLKENLEKMNWLSITILKFGLMLACTILIIGLVLQYNGLHSVYTLPIDMGKIGISLFTEACISALLIDYYVKKHFGKQDDK